MIDGPGILPISGKPPKKLVVLFHGYGSCGEDLLSIAHYWKNLLPETEFVAPNGHEKWEGHSSSGYQWFGLKEMTSASIRASLDKTGPIMKTYLEELLQKRSLNLADLALVGFSQGGMLALEMIFVSLGIKGVISYSGGYYPPVNAQRWPLQIQTKALLVHGDEDTIVPYPVLQDTKYHLQQIGIVPRTLTCRGVGHSVSREGIESGGKFLDGIFAKN